MWLRLHYRSSCFAFASLVEIQTIYTSSSCLQYLSVCLQNCQWLWGSTVRLPKPTHCPVHQEAKDHQQIPHEEVSLQTDK